MIPKLGNINEPGTILVAVLACGISAFATTWTSDNGNPLFYDEFSDPDMIRVGADFCLTGTAMHSMPGLPLLHSRDLLNWEFLRYPLERLDLGPAFHIEDGKNVFGQGIWAPCLRFHKGTFYIFRVENHSIGAWLG